MKKTLLNLLVANTLSFGVVCAAEPVAVAPDRGTPYQQEVRAAFIEHGWSIIGERAGRLVAEQPLKDTYGTLRHLNLAGNDSYAHILVDFHPSSKNPTDSTVYTTLCIYKMREKFELAYPLIDLHDANVDHDYRNIVAEAKSHLATGNRTHAVGKMGNVLEANDAKKVVAR